MESKVKRSENDKCDQNSLGILNLDNLNVFGEISRNNSTTSNNNCNSRVSEKLNIERKKAFETLQKSKKNEIFKRPQSISSANKENIKNHSTINKTPGLDQTDYVPLRRPNTINISDLITDETIHLESSGACPPPASNCKDVKISFEPTEITGRSTLYNSDLKLPRSIAGSSCRLSVSDILATSFAPKARNLCETLRSIGDNTLDIIGVVDTSHVSAVAPCGSNASSSFTNYNGLHSLPRTADMSLSKASCSEFSLEGCGGTFSFSKARNDLGGNDSVISLEEFAPGELMQSKLIMDEISWAQEYAAIPTAALSKQAKAKATADNTSNALESGSTASSMAAADPDFSMGKFFNMRSDNIWDIVKCQSPVKCRMPVALVANGDNEKTTRNSLVSNNEETPKIDNKTYSKVIAANKTNKTTTNDSNKQADKRESKDSGHETHNPYLLSMSAIDRALCDLDIQTDDSEVGVVNQILSKARRGKLSKSPQRSDISLHKPLSAEIKKRAVDTFECIAEIISENKENLDPEAVRAATQFSDTMSFTESLLNSSDSKQLQRTQPRSPLSPIYMPPPQIKVTAVGDIEADIDEWPSSPIKSPQRRVRRTKSPQQQRLTLTCNLPAETEIDKTPVNRRTPQSKRSASPSTLINDHTPPTPAASKAANQPRKSSSSTRLESNNYGSMHGSTICNFVTSPNLCNTATRMGSSNTSPRASDCGSPAAFEVSPMSSPHSYLSSPSNGIHSPQLDSTTNSEGRYMQARAVQTAMSSPVVSEPGARSKYEAGRSAPVGAPKRSCSCTSLKSAGVTAVRSISRCSNSSEFSHCDGKLIPLKVTALQLSWSSTKLRTNARKSMQVKNTAGKRLVIRMQISGPGFEMVNADSKTLTLQSQECRSIVINFSPTVTGAAIGALSFYSPQCSSASGNTPFLQLPLYGYGGNAVIITQHIYVGPVGSAFLTMGDLQELHQPLKRSFKIYNKGPLKGFAFVTLDSNGLNLPRLCDAFEVSPQQMLIQPGETATVRVVFRPKREDFKKIIKKIQSVLTLANMRVITGDDANRQRMRRLVQRMSPDERQKLTSSALDQLWTKFPAEVDLTELEVFKEPTVLIYDLMGSLHVHEIALTLNHDSLDETAESTSLYFPDCDETVLFRTVCAASPSPQHMLDPVDELLEDTATEDERAVSSTCEGTWSVSPSQLDFDFYAERRSERVSLLIRNSFKSPQYFEVTCSHKHWLSFIPSEGYVQPDGGQIEIEVQSLLMLPPQHLNTAELILIMVSMENERITVSVKLPKDNYAQH